MNDGNPDPPPAPFSRLGLGTGTLASIRGGLSLREASRLLDTARDLGINLIDTADSYASGECERMLGRIIAARKGAFRIMTKAGYATADFPWPLHRINPLAKKLMHKFGKRQNFDSRYLEQALVKSLRRLRIDEVDVFLLHDPPATALSDGSVFATLDHLRNKGLAIRVGISSGDDACIEKAIQWQGCGLIQTPLNANGKLAGSLQSKRRADVPVILNHVSLGGRLPGLESGHDPDLEEIRNEIRLRCRDHLENPQSSLLRIALDSTDSDCVLTGTRNPSHLIENARAVFAES